MALFRLSYPFLIKFTIKDWLDRKKLNIKYYFINLGREKITLSEELNVFALLILNLQNKFQKRCRLTPDVIILRNRARDQYDKYKNHFSKNKTYLEKFIDAKPRSPLDYLNIVCIHEPSLGKPDIEMIRYGTSIVRETVEPIHEHEFGTISLRVINNCVINGCEKDLILSETLT